MADVNSNINNSIADYIETMTLDMEGTMKSIDLTLKAISKRDGIVISQSSLKDLADIERSRQERERAHAVDRNPYRGPGEQSYGEDSSTGNRTTGQRSRSNDSIEWDKREGKRKATNMFDKLTDDFEDAFKEAIGAGKNSFKETINKSLNEFFDQLNFDINDLGKILGKQAGEAFKNSWFGKRLTAEFNWIGNQFKNILGKGTNGLAEKLNKMAAASLDNVSPDIKEAVKEVNTASTAENKAATATENIKEAVSRSEQAAKESVVTQRIREVESAQEADNQRKQSAQSYHYNPSSLSRAKAFDSEIGDFVDVDMTNVRNVENKSNISSAASDLIKEVFTGENGGVKGILNKGIGALSKGLTQAGSEAVSAGTEIAVAEEGMAAAGTGIAEAGAAAGTELAGVGAAAAGATAAFPALSLAIVGVSLFFDAMQDEVGKYWDKVKESLDEFDESWDNAANRQITANTKYLELQKKRHEEDIKSIKEAAYTIIEDAANKVQEVWDAMLSTVTAVQGYDKAGAQDLWSAYAERLKKEGLASVVSSADIMTNLENVLKSGLSGVAAEEFAYQATLLNAAIPNEDFFQYGATYASIIANAMKDGADQEHAIALANQELNVFADNLLHASRQLSGGLTTSLSNAASLFESSAKIAVASRTADISEISRLLTSVSGVVGAIAPDLADSIVSAVVDAAMGGNSSELTALRSLAGTGASNTAFLQALAADPQKVFTTLFYNLSQLQNMSAANYMEVAEALSSVFGISMDAFARVDFEYLAEAIAQMNDSGGDLQKSMDLLASGQTTLNDSQFRIQKINEYMIDEGLAYVLDNEVARSIQQHMWDEQLAREIEETMFAVDLAGDSITLLNDICNAVIAILNFLNPLAWIQKAINVGLTAIEAAAQTADLKEILERGKVGQGNQQSFYNLTTSGESLNLATPYLNLLGGVSSMNVASNVADQLPGLINIGGFGLGGMIGAIGNVIGAVDDFNEALDNYNAEMEQTEEIFDETGKLIEDFTGKIAEDYTEAVIESGKNLGQQAQEINPTQPAEPVGSYYKRSIISKSVASLVSSGDWRTNAGYNAIWENFGDSGTDLYGTPTAEDAKELSELIMSSIQTYTEEAKNTSRSLDDVRKEMTSDKNDILIQRDAAILEQQGQIEHRGFYTNAEMVSMVAAKSAEAAANGSAASFQGWLEQFQEEAGIGNLAALLSDYGESIQTIEAIYNQQEALRENAAEKARQLHEVQFWEDMQQFATIDFPWFLREWERYYIQHEAYTEATDNAFQDAIDIAVKEKGEMGDSVLALAEALIENNIWATEGLGDKLKDPVMQTNVILSKILLTVEAIMQQTNESSIVSVPTALSALGLSISNV